jgi:hypothetical protein
MIDLDYEGETEVFEGKGKLKTTHIVYKPLILFCCEDCLTEYCDGVNKAVKEFDEIFK